MSTNPNQRKRPWLGVLQRLGMPDYDHLARSTPTVALAAGPRVAVCLAGQARALVEEVAWRSTAAYLSANYPLYLVLATGSQQTSSGNADRGAPDACKMQHALNGLRPRRLRLVLRENTEAPACGNAATGQYARWADCIELLRQDEAESAAGPFDYLLRARPDLQWHSRAEVDALARRAAMLPGRPVVTSNDWAMLLARRHFGMLTALGSSLLCDERCVGQAGGLGAVSGSRYNEYCLLMAHLAAHGVSHIEANHPDTPEVRHYVSRAAWSASLRQPTLTLLRRSPVRSRRGLATLCRRSGIGNADWRCAYCRAKNQSDGGDDIGATPAVPPCPAATWDVPLPLHTSPALPGAPRCADRRALWERWRATRLNATGGAARPGHCGGTAAGTPCSNGTIAARGSYDASRLTLEGCVALCQGCDRCHFVSYSANARDCSWYAHCNAVPILAGSDGHMTLRVRPPSHEHPDSRA